jgi:hypothetical protein
MTPKKRRKSVGEFPFSTVASSGSSRRVSVRKQQMRSAANAMGKIVGGAPKGNATIERQQSVSARVGQFSFYDLPRLFGKVAHYVSRVVGHGIGSTISRPSAVMSCQIGATTP